MADIVNQFEYVLVSYEDVRREHPTWSDLAIEDYMARQRDLVATAETVTLSMTINDNDSLSAMVFDMKAKMGTGDPLTVDDTGFTADNAHLTVDRTEY